MTNEEHAVRLRRIHGFAFDATYAGGGTLRLDEPPPLGEGGAPNPAAVLASAVGACLSASLTLCLQKSRVEPRALTAAARPVLARNEAGRLRIAEVTVDIEVDTGEADRPRVERCVGIFEQYCTVTASVRAAFPVRVTVRDASGRAYEPRTAAGPPPERSTA